jgi:hypothetical protein
MRLLELVLGGGGWGWGGTFDAAVNDVYGLTCAHQVPL